MRDPRCADAARSWRSAEHRSGPAIVAEVVLHARTETEQSARRWLAIALISLVGLGLLTVAVMSRIDRA